MESSGQLGIGTGKPAVSAGRLLLAYIEIAVLEKLRGAIIRTRAIYDAATLQRDYQQRQKCPSKPGWALLELISYIEEPLRATCFTFCDCEGIEECGFLYGLVVPFVLPPPMSPAPLMTQPISNLIIVRLMVVSFGTFFAQSEWSTFRIPR